MEQIYLLKCHFIHFVLCFTALHEALKDNLNEGLVDHNARSCIACNPEAGSVGSDIENMEEFGSLQKVSKIVLLVLWRKRYYSS